ncbi:hypothetical protein C8R45DRAFT_1221564 [Mycena sanguinolenta]|nr:hypothetical protein C8R45DRAFT_1221564 [Mycena sanguinolenta]
MVATSYPNALDQSVSAMPRRVRARDSTLVLVLVPSTSASGRWGAERKAAVVFFVVYVLRVLRSPPHHRRPHRRPLHAVSRRTGALHPLQTKPSPAIFLAAARATATAERSDSPSPALSTPPSSRRAGTASSRTVRAPAAAAAGVDGQSVARAGACGAGVQSVAARVESGGG